MMLRPAGESPTCGMAAAAPISESRSRLLNGAARPCLSVMPRLFTGLEIPPAIVQSLATLRGGLPGARWVDPENYHMTLRFIGDVDDAIAREIVSMLTRVRRPSFVLRVEDLKAFGCRTPRAVVATL